MAEFTADVYQNEFLPDGGTDVHAIVTITCTGAGEAGRSGEGDAAEVIVVDTSGSMGIEKIAAAQTAAKAALDQILDGTWFAVIAGSHEARLAYPAASGELGMVRMDGSTRAAAKSAVVPVPRGRRHRHGHLADHGGAGLRLGPRGHPEARHPADRRRSTSTRRRRRCRPRSPAPAAGSSATAAVSAVTGRSPRCAASPPSCSARST